MDSFSFANEMAAIRRELITAYQQMQPRDLIGSNVLSAVLSVGLAIIVCQWLQMEYSTWAAFSAYVIMRPVFKQTWHRGLLRIAGTLLGALCGIGFLLFTGELSLGQLCLALLLVNTASAYYTNTASDEYNYAILFFGLTFSLVVSYSYAYPEVDILQIGITRSGDVMIGCLSTIAVTLLFQRFWPAKADSHHEQEQSHTSQPEPEPQPELPLNTATSRNSISHPQTRERQPQTAKCQQTDIDTKPPATAANVLFAAAPVSATHDLRWPFSHMHFLFALVAGGTIALTPVSMLVYPNELFIEAAISILAVSNQPRTVQANELPISTVRKLLYRATGCFLGGVVGILFNLLSVAANSEALLMLFTLLGTAFGRLIQDSTQTASYVGTQFTLGILIVCVHDSTQLVNASFGVYRFAGVLMGLLIFVPVLLMLAALYYRFGHKGTPASVAP